MENGTMRALSLVKNPGKIMVLHRVMEVEAVNSRVSCFIAQSTRPHESCGSEWLW
jgi:hypothetical protein